MIKPNPFNILEARVNLVALVFWLVVATCCSVYGIYAWNTSVIEGAGLAWLWAGFSMNSYRISKMQNAQPTVTITFGEKSDDNDQK